MAEQHHKPEIATPTTRCYTVGLCQRCEVPAGSGCHAEGPLAEDDGIWDGDGGGGEGFARLPDAGGAGAAAGTARRAGGGDHPEAGL